MHEPLNAASSQAPSANPSPPLLTESRWRNKFILLIGASAMVWYFYCLLGIGLEWEPKGEFRDFMQLSITTIGATLATFVGMLIGFGSIEKTIQKASRDSSNEIKETLKELETTSLQWCAAILYFLSIVLALWLWQEGSSDAAIVSLGKSILGLVGGALSVFLNLPRQ